MYDFSQVGLKEVLQSILVSSVQLNELKRSFLFKMFSVECHQKNKGRNTFDIFTEPLEL